jgi:hypothetical protein
MACSRAKFYLLAQRNTEARSRNHCCRGKVTSITYLCVCADAWMCACACARVAFIIQQAEGTSRIKGYAPPHFSASSHKRHNFRKTVIEHEMCVLSFCTKSETFLILRGIQADMVTSSRKTPIILVRV